MLKDRIAHIMRSKNLTATQLADELQVQRSGISHLLSGRNKPSLDFVMKLKEIYPEFNLDWLIMGNGPITVSGPRKMEQKPQQLLFEEEQEAGLKDEQAKTTGSEAKSGKDGRELTANQQEESTKKAPSYDGALLNSLNAGIEKIILVYEDQSFEVLQPKQLKTDQTD